MNCVAERGTLPKRALLPGRKDPPEKIADVLRDLTMMGLEGEMPCVEQVDLGIGQILLVGERSCWNEGRVMPAPDGEERGLVLPEVSLELGVQRDIRAIVQNEVELHLLRARSRHVSDVEFPTVRAQQLGIGAGPILPIAYRFG